MSDMNEKTNPLLQIDTGFRSYLNAYTRSYQSHMVDGSLDYAFESDFAIRQKIMGLSGSGKLFKAVNSQDISAEAKHLFMKCNQVGPLKYPEIYDIVKKSRNNAVNIQLYVCKNCSNPHRMKIVRKSAASFYTFGFFNDEIPG